MYFCRKFRAKKKKKNSEIFRNQKPEFGNGIASAISQHCSLFYKNSQTFSRSVLKKVKKLVNEINSSTYSYRNTFLNPLQIYKRVYRFRLFFPNVNQNNSSNAHAHLTLFAMTDLGKKK